ncbi:unnamed protein product [Pseudo-nitzschia multistriata]|uniref:Uncharacterized protein n=1 Tax=Pseudo-nitzschia multistriata TaxID=183589 RepID=A0A448Z951_9STRA|nr:unnamed protein product [Pseudo-nitzschia multistriata]
MAFRSSIAFHLAYDGPTVKTDGAEGTADGKHAAIENEGGGREEKDAVDSTTDRSLTTETRLQDGLEAVDGDDSSHPTIAGASILSKNHSLLTTESTAQKPPIKIAEEGADPVIEDVQSTGAEQEQDKEQGDVSSSKRESQSMEARSEETTEDDPTTNRLQTSTNQDDDQTDLPDEVTGDKSTPDPDIEDASTNNKSIDIDIDIDITAGETKKADLEATNPEALDEVKAQRPINDGEIGTPKDGEDDGADSVLESTKKEGAATSAATEDVLIDAENSNSEVETDQETSPETKDATGNGAETVFPIKDNLEDKPKDKEKEHEGVNDNVFEGSEITATPGDARNIHNNDLPIQNLQSDSKNPDDGKPPDAARDEVTESLGDDAGDDADYSKSKTVSSGGPNQHNVSSKTATDQSDLEETIENSKDKTTAGMNGIEDAQSGTIDIDEKNTESSHTDNVMDEELLSWMTTSTETNIDDQLGNAGGSPPGKSDGDKVSVIDEELMSWMTTPNQDKVEDKSASPVPTPFSGSNGDKSSAVDDEQLMSWMTTPNQEKEIEDDDSADRNGGNLLGEQIVSALDTAEIDVVGAEGDEVIAPETLADIMLENIEKDAIKTNKVGRSLFGANSLYSIGGETSISNTELEPPDDAFTDDLLRDIANSKHLEAEDDSVEQTIGEEMVLVADSILNILLPDGEGEPEAIPEDAPSESTGSAEKGDNGSDGPSTSHRFELKPDGSGGSGLFY